jgi:hypothetical protein
MYDVLRVRKYHAKNAKNAQESKPEDKIIVEIESICEVTFRSSVFLI